MAKILVESYIFVIVTYFAILAAFQTVICAWKTLDIVINNAGIMDDLHWELEIAVNFVNIMK